MTQPSLFSVPETARRRRTDPITSFWPTQGIDVSASEGLTLNAFAGAGPGTSHELSPRLQERGPSISPQRVRTALTTLEKRGLTYRTGRYGVSEYGKKAEIWSRR